MSYSAMLTAVLICSLVTGLITEAVKMLLKEWNKAYKPNTLAAVVSVLVGAGYALIWRYGDGAVWTAETTIKCTVPLILCSWLCAMLGYDKVVQTIKQFVKGDAADDEKDAGATGDGDV